MKRASTSECSYPVPQSQGFLQGAVLKTTIASVECILFQWGKRDKKGQMLEVCIASASVTYQTFLCIIPTSHETSLFHVYCVRDVIKE